MNLAVHGLSGDIRQGVTYYEDLHKSLGKFDFVMANPPFNVDKVDKERIKDDPRYPFSLPKADNANYLWIQLFYSALNATGRAGFVMANSAGDATRVGTGYPPGAAEVRSRGRDGLDRARTSSTQSPCHAPCGSSTRGR